ncbi:MAG: DNA-3-methyladenine glycosylase I [Hyphomicrobiales bacterium]|nr:DNA-3-methyladenine glycosylase I [Hyphomicrobiales bacterium]MCY4049403.1 DNA-3-methyladenine glycosylase I [Hyphomicrobiales bacterium]
MKKRCVWCGDDPLYVDYHDQEWGVPERDDRALFEKLMLDGFQAGLSWITILRKRENFRRAFENFNPEKVASFNKKKVSLLLRDASIIRHRGKIEATITNAQAYLKIQETTDGFAAFLWDFVDGKTLQNKWKDMNDVPAQTPMSEAMSKELKRRGFKFCGPTIVYAFAQASGLVNDHTTQCFRHKECKRLSGKVRS